MTLQIKKKRLLILFKVNQIITLHHNDVTTKVVLGTRLLW